MSGHSKWSTIKHKKAAQDAKRSKVFTRILKEVVVAARLGGGDPTGNPRLRHALSEAKAHNVPGDNIDRAIKKGTGELEGVSYEEVAYEGYGPGGVAILVETLTDNRNRTVSEVRHLFTKHGGNLGENGCVAWMFHRRGFFAFDREAMEESGIDEEALVELALELEAEDFSVEKDNYNVYTSVDAFLATRDEVEARGLVAGVARLTMEPQNLVRVDETVAGQLVRLIDALEDQDDVQHVWSNFDLDDELLERLAS
jgi:YebC/PmpR family DNA-binding regulatory protein